MTLCAPRPRRTHRARPATAARRSGLAQHRSGRTRASRSTRPPRACRKRWAAIGSVRCESPQWLPLRRPQCQDATPSRARTRHLFINPLPDPGHEHRPTPQQRWSSALSLQLAVEKGRVFDEEPVDRTEQRPDVRIDVRLERRHLDAELVEDELRREICDAGAAALVGPGV